MFFSRWLSGSTLARLAWVGSGLSFVSFVPNSNAIDCDVWSRDEWVQRLEATLDAAPKDVDWSTLSGLFGDPKCLNRLDSLGLNACTKAINLMSLEHGRSYRDATAGPGFTDPDTMKNYVHNLEAKYPGLWDMPSEFQGKVPSNWEDIVNQNAALGWSALRPKNMGGSDPRAIIHIPKSANGGYDQWFNIGPQEDEGRMVVAQITIIKTVVNGANTFLPLFAAREAPGQFDSPLSKPGQPGRCLNCHMSGIRNVFVGSNPNSLVSSGTGGDAAAVRNLFDRQMMQYGALNFQGLYYPERMGPPLALKAGGASSCANCHNGSYRGIINAGNRYDKVLEHVQEGFMPPNASGSTVAIFNQALADYPAIIKQWAGLQSCPQQ